MVDVPVEGEDLLCRAVVAEDPLFKIHHEEAFIQGGENEVELLLLRLETIAGKKNLVAQAADLLAEVGHLHRRIVPEGVEGEALLLLLQQLV